MEVSQTTLQALVWDNVPLQAPLIQVPVSLIQADLYVLPYRNKAAITLKKPGRLPNKSGVGPS